MLISPQCFWVDPPYQRGNSRGRPTYYIDGVEVVQRWSDQGDPLFDPADADAAVYRDTNGQHYLHVEHWNGGRHVMRITPAEAEQIISTHNHRRVFWQYLYGQIETAEQGNTKKAERLEAEMRLKWEEK